MSLQEHQTIQESSSNVGIQSQVTLPVLVTPSPSPQFITVPQPQVIPSHVPTPPLFSQSVVPPLPQVPSSIIPPPPPPPMPPSLVPSMTPSLVSPLMSLQNSQVSDILSDKSTQRTKQGGLILEKTYSSLEQQSRNAYKYFKMTNGLTEEADCPYLFLSSYRPVTPVIQSGPICGLVALAMASELTSNRCITTEEVFEQAKAKGYTKQGEIFSAQALGDLASHFLCCDVECIKLKHNLTTLMLDGHDLVGHLMKGNLVLIPYDADRNHGPCQKKGHKAHWALLTGFYAALKISEAPEFLMFECKRDVEYPSLYYWPDSSSMSCSDQFTRLIGNNIGGFLVFGHHGKSKYAGVWSLEDLLLSNDNLMEAGTERNSEEYILPPGGVEAGLKSQIVVLKKNLQTRERF